VLEEGSDFTLFVSEGPMFRVLPDVAGLTAEAAAATLTDLQLQSFVDAEEFDEVAEPGIVLSWRVLGAEASVSGDEVLPGTNLALVVSKGPAPRVVADVTGLTLEDAQATAGQVQLKVVAGEDAFSDDVPAGIIIRQDTAVGVELPRDGTITVVRSKGPDLIALPALDGLSYTAAQQALTDAGFAIGSLLGTTEGTFLSISISAEPIGDLYRRGTSVDLIFL
jgi:beta-lactam-binding protein with PASTA domain